MEYKHNVKESFYKITDDKGIFEAEKLVLEPFVLFEYKYKKDLRTLTNIVFKVGVSYFKRFENVNKLEINKDYIQDFFFFHSEM